LRLRGYKITVFTLHYPFTKKEYTWKDTRVIPLNGANNGVKKTFFLFAKLKSAFKRIHKTQPFDLIHSFWLNEASLFGQKLSSQYKIPILATSMGQDVLDSNRYKNKVISKNIPTTVLSEFQSNFIAQQKTEIIPFGVKNEVISLEKTNDLIFIGSLIKLKNPHFFLELCKHLKGKDLKIKVIGSGPEEAKCKAFTEKHELTTVEIMGECSYEQTQAYLAASKILIHCSSFESFGMIFVEAMANGVHVLSSPVGFAYNNPKVHALTFELKKDTEKVKQLLGLPAPKPIIYSVDATVDAYEKRYASLFI
jgi:glycosyltransferase involved in cell wall biosynthesis